MNTAIVVTNLVGIGGKQVSGFSGEGRKYCLTANNLETLLEKLPKDFEFMSPTSSNEGKEISILIRPCGSFSHWVPDVAHKPKAVKKKPSDELDALLAEAGLGDNADIEELEESTPEITPTKVEVQQPVAKTIPIKVVQDTRAVVEKLKQTRAAKPQSESPSTARKSATATATKVEPKAKPVVKQDPAFSEFSERVRNWMLANQDGGSVESIAKPSLSLRFNKGNLHTVESRLNNFFGGRMYLKYSVAHVENEFLLKVKLGDYQL